MEIKFDPIKTKTEIIEKLRSIQHTGGETSAAVGVNLAIQVCTF